MSYGYSRKLVAANKKANAASVGVRLGRLCIKRDLPVAVVSETLGVSRMTVYNWFCGVTNPTPELEARILTWVAQATQPTAEAQ